LHVPKMLLSYFLPVMHQWTLDVNQTQKPSLDHVLMLINPLISNESKYIFRGVFRHQKHFKSRTSQLHLFLLHQDHLLSLIDSKLLRLDREFMGLGSNFVQT
jgi:hypothetical protein